MSKHLKDMLFSWYDDIILEMKNEIYTESKIKGCQKNSFLKVEKNELDFILEIIVNGMSDRIGWDLLEGGEVSLRSLVELVKNFKNKCIDKIMNDEISNEDKLYFIKELNALIDQVEMRLVDKYSEEDKIYLNIDTVGRIGESIIMILKDEEIYYANDIAKRTFNLDKNRGNHYGVDELFHKMKRINTGSSDNIDPLYEGKVKNMKNPDDKNEKWIEFRKSSFVMDKIGLQLVFGHDVSERKKIEKKLKDSEKKYKTLLEVMPDPLYVYNDNGITYANHAAIKMFGYTKFEEVENKKLNQLWSIDEESQSKYQQKMDKLNRTGKIDGVEKTCTRLSDGKVLELETAAAFYSIGDNDFIINITRDIKEKNKISKLKLGVREKSLKLAEARKYDELKNEFLANISHEFKTPINIIMTANELLETLASNEALDKESLMRYTFLSRQNCYRLIKLVDNILDITKIDAGAMELNLEKGNIIEFVENVTDSVREYIASKELSLIFDTDEEENEIVMDKTKIERILLNLLSNSAKYTNAGGTIKVNLFNKEDDVILEVEDDGIGIPKDKQKEIFERFIQVDKTLTRNKEGSGIGLSLVKELVDIHRGNIQLISDEGKGTKFIITIPKNDQTILKQFKENKFIDKKTRTLIESIDVQFSDIYAQW